MQKRLSTILFSLLTLPLLSQEFNDSIMNTVMFEEIMSYTQERGSTAKIYYSNVGAKLYSDGAIRYIKYRAFDHRPSHKHIRMLSYNDNRSILTELNLLNTVDLYLVQSELLVKVDISGKTTYQDVAKRALNGWLNSPRYKSSIENLGRRCRIEVVSISSYYESGTKTIFIAMTNFGAF